MTLPISLTGTRAMFSIATLSRGRAPLAVCLAVFLLGFAALEIRAQEEPTRLDELVVSDGQVRFGFISAGRCIQISNTSINGVTYTIHSSYWQRRSGAGSPWEQISGTQETGQVCSLSPDSAGEYRLVADITIGNERGFYKSNTILDHDPGQVTGVRVAEGVEQLTVSWNEITDSGPGWNGAEGYVVEWKSGSEIYSSRRRHRVDGGSITSDTITGLTAGTAYTVRVSAKLASTTGGFPHDGKPSDEVTATPRAMTGTDPATGLAPADQAAFNSLAVGKQIVDPVSDDRLVFLSPGRIREFDQGESYDGDYQYVNTGENMGTLTYTYDVTGNNPNVEKSVVELTFTSMTAGTFVHTYTESGSPPETLRGSFEFVDAPAEPVVEGNRAVLEEFYDATNGANWSSSTNWGSSRPLGEWYGVVTNQNGRVTQLSLEHNQLTGVLPAALGSLTNLEVLDLFDNQLTGSIPAALGSLTNLRGLWIYYNQLSGSIPGSLGNLFNLETLALSPGNDELCAPNDEAFQAWLKSIGELVWTGPTCTADAVEPKPADEVQATVDAAVAAGGGLRAGGPPVTIDMSTLFSLGEGGSVDTTFTARSSDPALVLAAVTDERLVLTPGNAQLSNLAVGATETLDGDPARATITVTAVRAGEIAEVEFTVEVEAAPADEPTPTMLTLSAAPAPAEGGNPVTVTATLDNPAPATGLTVTLTTSGTATLDTDYTLSSTTITIAEGETAGTVTITVTDDAESLSVILCL